MSPFLSAVLSLFLLVPASITWAQFTKTLNGTVRYESGISRSTFTTPNGNVIVDLPQSLSGTVISGTVTTEPTGKNEKEKKRNLKELLKMTVTLGDQANSLLEIPFLFDWKPNQVQGQRTPLRIFGPLKEKIGEVELSPVIITPNIVNPQEPGQLSVPSNVMVKGDLLNVYTDKQFTPGEKFVVKDASGQEFVLKPKCMSAQQAVIELPNNIVPGELTVSEELWNQPIQQYNLSKTKLNLIDLNISSPNTNLKPGQKSVVLADVVWINPDIEDLLNLPLPNFCIDLRNLNPNSVTMEGGNFQRVQVEPDPKTGKAQIRRAITGKTVGAFSVSATLHEDFNTSNDPFRPQLNVLNTPETFNRWASALKKDLNNYANVTTTSEDEMSPRNTLGSVPYTTIKRAINNLPVCTSPDMLPECKAVSEALLQTLNIPKEAVKYWPSTMEAYNIAFKSLENYQPGNSIPVDYDLLKIGLQYFKALGNKLGYNIRNKSEDAARIIQQINQAGETNENIRELNNSLIVLNNAYQKALNEMPQAMNMILPGGIFFSTRFTRPGTTDLSVEVTDISWTQEILNLEWHFTSDITVKDLSARVNWTSKDGKKSGTAEAHFPISDIPEYHKETTHNFHNCDTLLLPGVWPNDFKSTGIVEPLSKEDIDLDKVKVILFVDGKKVGEGKPEEYKKEEGKEK